MPPTPDDDSDNEPVSSLFVSIRLDESAHVSVNANLFVPKDKQPGVASIKSALEETLSCRLIDDPLLHTTYKAAQGFYLGSCDLPRSPSMFLHEGSLRITPLLDLGRNASIQLLGANLFLPSSDLAEALPPPTSVPAVPKPFSAVANRTFRRAPPPAPHVFLQLEAGPAHPQSDLLPFRLFTRPNEPECCIPVLDTPSPAGSGFLAWPPSPLRRCP